MLSRGERNGVDNPALPITIFSACEEILCFPKRAVFPELPDKRILRSLPAVVKYRSTGKKPYRGISKMSEYQYYEFQAVDRALSKEDRAELRRISSRAQITATNFTNHYEWGDLKANPGNMVKLWFDLHLYLANWGSRRFMIRLPKKFIDRDRFADFLPGIDEVAIYDSGDNTIFDVDIAEMSEDSYEWDDGSGWLAALAPLRADLLSGDLRVLYLAWLIGVQWEIVPGNEMEPLPGIGQTNGGLEAFADFFRIDPDLLQAASESGAVSETPELSAETFRTSLEAMPDEEKPPGFIDLFRATLA